MRLRQYVRNSVYVVCNIFFLAVMDIPWLQLVCLCGSFLDNSITKLNLAHRCILISFHPVKFFCHSLHASNEVHVR